jgi:hypothetical protein
MDMDMEQMTNREFRLRSKRSSMFRLQTLNLNQTEDFGKDGLAGKDDGGWTTEQSWSGWKRRLLYAITSMTEDSFDFLSREVSRGCRWTRVSETTDTYLGLAC